MINSTNSLLSIVIPCFNEKKLIVDLVKMVKNSPYTKKEIIIIDDCSTDGTREVIKNEIEHGVAKVIYHDKNMGKGAAIRSGLKFATGDIVIVQDADLEYDPCDYAKLIKPILEGKADVVYGSRFINSRTHRTMFLWNMIANRMLTLLSNMFSNLKLSDMETCYKMFKKEILDKITIEENRFGFEPEITAKIAKLKCRIYEVGISYKGRSYLEGKKIGFKDALTTLRCILKYNLFS